MVPIFSVIVPLYNKSGTLQKSITSVLTQTFQDFEIIIVNDGSTDDSLSIANTMTDSRIRIFSKENGGVSSARNYGIRKARADIVAFLDADDSWQPQFLNTIFNLIVDYPSAQWFATSYLIQDPNVEAREVKLSKIPDSFKRGIISNYFEIAANSEPPVHSSSVAVKKSALESLGGFPEGVHNGEDIFTWAKLAAHFPLAYDLTPCTTYQHISTGRPADPSRTIHNGLIQLSMENSDTPHLKAYIALWNRMQALTALRFGQRELVGVFARDAFFYNPQSYKNLYVLLLSLLPMKWARAINSSRKKHRMH